MARGKKHTPESLTPDERPSLNLLDEERWNLEHRVAEILEIPPNDSGKSLGCWSGCQIEARPVPRSFRSYL
jgi:hypothetical protein